MFLSLLTLHVVILPWSNAGVWHLLPLLFCFMLLFITIYDTDFYLFVPCFSLLISFLSHFVPLLHSTIGFWCLLALHMVFLPWNSTGLSHSPSCCFVLDYPFIDQILHFLSFSFLPLCSCDCSPVSHYHLLAFLLSWRVSLQICTDYHAPLPLNYLNQPYWLTPSFYDFSLPTLFYKHFIGATGFLLDAWTLKMRLIGCPEMSVRK